MNGTKKVINYGKTEGKTFEYYYGNTIVIYTFGISTRCEIQQEEYVFIFQISQERNIRYMRFIFYCIMVYILWYDYL